MNLLLTAFECCPPPCGAGEPGIAGGTGPMHGFAEDLGGRRLWARPLLSGRRTSARSRGVATLLTVAVLCASASAVAVFSARWHVRASLGHVEAPEQAGAPGRTFG